jgi:very-short-patch-repair endonuclease
MSTGTARARSLRRRMTDPERRIWARLRDRRLAGYKFRRQVPIGPYVVDFLCVSQRLAIEIDGGRHATQMAADAARTDYLRSCGIAVLRFWSNEIYANLDGVLDAVWRRLQDAPPDRS